MGLKSIFFGMVIMVLCACNPGPQHNTKPAIAKDTLLYTYKTITERSAKCNNKVDSTCATAEIKYLVFNDQKALNDTITQQLLNTYGDEKPARSLPAMAKNFVESGDDDTSGNKNGASYELNLSSNVVRQDSSLITIQIDSYAYAGGAHGSEYTGFINWNTKANKKITLDDILVGGYLKKLTPIGEKIFRAQEKLSDTSSFENYLFDDGKFVLPKTFLITPIGIQFLYNDYEAKPYSEGQTTLLVPYVQIKSLLRPNTVLNQYIK